MYIVLAEQQELVCQEKHSSFFCLLRYVGHAHVNVLRRYLFFFRIKQYFGPLCYLGPILEYFA